MKLSQKQIVWGIGALTALVVIVIVVRVLTVPWPPLVVVKKMVPPGASHDDRVKQFEFAYSEVHRRPFFSFSWNSLGAAWYGIGDTKRAISSWKEAASLGGDAWLPRLNMARAYISLQKFTEARDQLREAHKIRPDNTSICFEYGDLLRNNFYPESVDELGQMYVACINAKEDPILRDRLGQLYMDLGKYKEALVIYEKLNKDHPDDGRFSAKIGDIKKILGLK